MNQNKNSNAEARIESIDLEPIKFKLVHQGRFTQREASILEKWYRRLLLLNFKYPDRPIVVSEAIDEFWHHHILDTRKYAEDCQEVFGKFLHHFPYFGLRGDEDQRSLNAAYRSTLDLMREEFGEVPEDELRVIGDDGASVEVSSSCSDCGGPPVPNPLERPRLSELVA